MLPGTTPTVTLTLPEAYDLDSAVVAYMSFGQGKEDLFDIPLADLTISDNVVTAHLTQTQTLKLDANVMVKIQLRWKDSDGEAYGTIIKKLTVEEIIKGGEI